MSHARSGKENLIFFNTYLTFRYKIHQINILIFFENLRNYLQMCYFTVLTLALTTGHYVPLTITTKVYEGKLRMLSLLKQVYGHT